MARKASFDRTEIIARARDLFWRKGFHATSLKDLEATLELKPGSIYAAFQSKEALFAEALKDYAETSVGELEAALQATDSPLDSLVAHARSLGTLCDAEHPSQACMLVKTILEHPDQDAPARILAERLIEEVGGHFIAGFRGAQAKGEISVEANPERLGRKFQSDVIGLRTIAQRSHSADIVRDLAEDLANGVEALRVA